MQDHAVIFLQRPQSCDYRFARLTELHRQLVDQGRVLVLEEVHDDCVVKR